MTLPTDINEIFFETLHGDRSVLEFEKWLYNDKRLERILAAEDYLDLISYGYKGDRVKYGLYKLLEKHIDRGEYEKWKLLKLLNKALQRDDDLPQILMMFYHLYCKGYNFLDNLGLGYGLAVEVPTHAESWDELTSEQQQSVINTFYPDIESEIRKVINWLGNGKVVLTGIEHEYSNYKYIDNRTEDEKLPTAYQIAPAGKPWWKFW